MDTIMEAVKAMASVKGIAAMLGLSVLGLLGVIGLLRSTIAEILEAVNKTKAFVAKYQELLTSPEAKADFQLVKMEWDEALEQAAVLADRLKLKALAKKLRDAI